MRILVLLGGTSAERDVSLASGVRIAHALRERGHEVTALDTARGRLSAQEEAHVLATSAVKQIPPTPAELARLEAGERAALAPILAGRASGSGAHGTHGVEGTDGVDVVLIALHGGRGEDGTLQALLDMSGIPYTGSGHMASALAMDKDLSKHLFRAAGVPTADWLMAPVTVAEITRTLGFPVVVKPSKQGSTVGLTVVKEAAGVESAIAEAFRYDDEVMVESFVAGRELTVGILGDQVLPVGEIIPAHEIYDYECKYTPGMAREEFPAKLTATETKRVQELALKAFRALKLTGCARIDFRMSSDGEFFCLEANTLPGMTGLSLIPQAAAAAGIGFPELCERIVALALEGRTSTATERVGA
ncbi:MAG: D-alanine--D-alanine ligase [Gemmatimonadaceae bacterium]